MDSSLLFLAQVVVPAGFHVLSVISGYHEAATKLKKMNSTRNTSERYMFNFIV